MTNFTIEIRDSERTLIYCTDCSELLEPSGLVEILESYRAITDPKYKDLQITQWMPNLKGHITIGEGH